MELQQGVELLIGKAKVHRPGMRWLERRLVAVAGGASAPGLTQAKQSQRHDDVGWQKVKTCAARRFVGNQGPVKCLLWVISRH